MSGLTPVAGAVRLVHPAPAIAVTVLSAILFVSIYAILTGITGRGC